MSGNIDDCGICDGNNTECGYMIHLTVGFNLTDDTIEDEEIVNATLIDMVYDAISYPIDRIMLLGVQEIGFGTASETLNRPGMYGDGGPGGYGSIGSGGYGADSAVDVDLFWGEVRASLLCLV
jgi:hypothetical protein